MAVEKVQDYTRDDTDGHVDTREANKDLFNKVEVEITIQSLAFC